MAKAKSNGAARTTQLGSEMPMLRSAAGRDRVLDARPDTPDFRDKLYEATLIEVPPRVDLVEYRQVAAPILDQGQEGACTGFGLAAVGNYLLRRRRISPDSTPVSARMFYELARRYDEWPGEDYSGSSARGAMKGWHKHGVCAEELWPYDSNNPRGRLDQRRAEDGLRRPLGAYYRVNHKDLVCMHSALAEVGILYATARVHQGWQSPGSDGRIVRSDAIIGGHAFAIVAYDEDGLWIQNSWGSDWGKDGFAHLSYDDWLSNGTDVWVARLGAPVFLRTPEATAWGNSVVAGRASGYTSSDLRPHIITLKNDGQLDPDSTYGKTVADIEAIVREEIPRITSGWEHKRILLYAHGGLVDEGSAVQHIADFRPALLAAQIYPLAFVWRSDFWSTLRNILAEAVARRRPEGVLDTTKNFMLDRLDDALEPVARRIGGKAQWDEMKENALAATTSPAGGAKVVARLLADLVEEDPSVEIHVAGHSAGSIFHAPLVQLLATGTGQKAGAGPMRGKPGLGLKIATCTLWAPACTVELFRQTYEPVIKSRRIGRFTIFTLTDQAEQNDHCARIYNKSLLYLVSNAFEEKDRIPMFRGGWPILGMEKFVRADALLHARLKKSPCEWVLAPNDEPVGSDRAARATSHGGFDDDRPTLQATLARITGASAAKTQVVVHASERLLRDRRLGIAGQTGDSPQWQVNDGGHIGVKT